MSVRSVWRIWRPRCSTSDRRHAPLRRPATRSPGTPSSQKTAVYINAIKIRYDDLRGNGCRRALCVRRCLFGEFSCTAARAARVVRAWPFLKGRRRGLQPANQKRTYGSRTGVWRSTLNRAFGYRLALAS
eukprot:scaffold7329_cov58-Phaeocystis_antarctica.AAC.2